MDVSPASKRGTARWVGWVRRHERTLLPGAYIVALAGYYLTPWPALAWLWLALLAALTWRSPRVALALLPLSFPFWFVPKRVYGHLYFPLSEIALAVIVAVVVARAVWRALTPSPSPRGRGERRLFPLSQRARGLGGAVARAWLARVGPLAALGGALLFVGMTLGLLVARRPHEALRAWRWEAVEPLVYLALAVWYLRGPRWVRMTLWAFVGSGLIIAALATAQVLGAHVTFTPVGSGERLVAYLPPLSGPYRATAIIYGSANSAGAWLERALPVALAIALLGRGLARRERLLAGATTLALLPALFWTDSRGAWLGAAAGLGLVALVWLAPIVVRAWEGYAASDMLVYRVWRWPVLVAAIAALALLWTAGSSLWGAALLRIATAGHTDTGAVRLLLWQSALHMIRDHPLLGIGPDQFLYYYDPAYTSHPYLISRMNGHPTIAVYQPDLAHPHNLILDLWLSAGLLGLIGYALVVVALARRGWRLWRRASGVAGATAAWRRIAVVGVLGALLATLTHGMLDSAYFQPDLALAFWWGVAALAALDRPHRARSLSAINGRSTTTRP